MTRGLNRAAVAMLLLLGCALAPRALATTAQDDSAEAAPVEIGAGPVGEQALRLVGRNEYRESSVLLYGYLSSVIGLDPASVFTDPDAPSAATARFTYAGEVAVTGVAQTGGVSQVRGSGTLTFYVNEDGGADFADPASFAAGTAVAVAQLRLDDTVERRAPGFGIVVGEGEATQVAAEPFRLDGEQYRFGHVGLRERLLVTGAEASGEPDSSAIVYDLTGSVVVTHRAPRPAGDRSPAATPTVEPAQTPGPADDATPPAATPTDAECAGVEAWLAEAVADGERVLEVVDAIPREATVGQLDAGALEDAAGALAEIAADRRGTAAPPSAEATNRLLVTAISTYARGTRLLASAAETGDEAAAAQALVILEDGDDLAARAGTQLGDLAAACGIEG